MVYIMYMYACEQARWARSTGNSAIENLCIIIIYYLCLWAPSSAISSSPGKMTPPGPPGAPAGDRTPCWTLGKGKNKQYIKRNKKLALQGGKEGKNLSFCDLKQSEVQSACSDSTHKGVNYHLKDVTQTQQRLESPRISLTWHLV